MFADVDFHQVRALIRFSLKSEWRTNSQRLVRGKRKTSGWWLVGSLVSYLAIGGMLGALFLRNHSAETFIAATALVSLYVLLLSASNIVLAFGSGFLSPTEIDVLAPFPISSETFYISRISIVLIYTLITSTTISLGPTIASIVLSPGNGFLSAIGMTLTISFSAISAAMAVITLYGIIIARHSHKSLSAVFGYVQMFGSLFMVSSFILMPQLLDKHAQLESISLISHPIFVALPPYWFASIEGVFTDISYPNIWAMAALAVATLIFLTLLSNRLLARSYRASVEDLNQSGISDAKRALRKRTESSQQSSRTDAIASLILRSPESRAIWTLFRSQFKFDVKFRNSILVWLPITGVYFVVAVLRGTIHDPFVAFNGEFYKANSLYLVAILSPLLIMQQLSQSESYKASWIFFALPIDRARLVLGVRNIMLMLIFVPYMTILCVAFAYYMPLGSAIRHTLMISAVAQLIFEGYMLIAPKMPFSEQRKQQKNTASRFFYVFALVIIPLGLMGFAMYFSYRDPTRYWASLAVAFTFVILGERVLRARLRKKLEKLEYAG